MAYKYVDILKSTNSHNKWEEVTSLLTTCSKDPNEIIDSISKSLLHLNNYSSKIRKQISRNDKEKSLKYIKLICKLNHLIYCETSRNGVSCLELSADCFRIIIVLNDNWPMQGDNNYVIFKQILFELNKEKPKGCPELLKSMSEGCYDQLLIHINELQTLYSVGHDKSEQSKAFLCLQSLEDDINKLSKCPINITNTGLDYNPNIPPPNNIIGNVKMRSGGIPAQFVFYCPNSSKIDCDSLNDRFKITLQLMNHNEKNLLPYIPLVNLQKDINGNCVPSFLVADSLKCVPLAAKFVLKLSKPMIVSDTNISSIISITGLDVVTTGMKTNYIDMILQQNGSSLIHKDQFFNILPNDTQMAFQITDDEINCYSKTVSCVPFLLPNQLPRVIAILKKQAIINWMMESFLLADLNTSFIKDFKNAQIVNVSIVSHDYFIFSYTQQNNPGNTTKFYITFNDLSQHLVKFIPTNKIDIDHHISTKFPQILQKYNNLPMALFWLLHKSGGITLMESFNDKKEVDTISDSSLNKTALRFIKDNEFVEECVQIVKNNLSICSVYPKDLFPTIKIEPKLELMTTTSQQIISPHSTTLMHDSMSTIGKTKPNFPHHQDHISQTMTQSSCQIDGNIQPQLPTINNNNNNNNTVLTPQIQQPLKSEPMSSYSNYGSKHMSLDQMLSSDFTMSFPSENMGSLNNLSHSTHYSEHSSHSSHPVMSTVANNTYPGHFMPHQKEVNPKIVRPYDTQSSVLVNLLNCNENPGSNNSTGFMNRPLLRNISNPPQMSEQFESPASYQHMSRIHQLPRMRMPNPNPPKSTATTASPRPTLSNISSSPPSKPDIMMMPYPQDTGNGRALMSRKPRKRKMTTLELNQRLPKQPLMQPPTLRQPVHHDMMHNNMPISSHSMPQMPSNIQQQHQPPSISSNFSSPTTMDQSIYDFDDNADCGRSRNMSSSASSSSQSNNFNNLANRKISNTAVSKKPLRVKISRKAISQNPGSQEFKTDPDLKMKEKLAKSSSHIPGFNQNMSNPRGSTAIMNAIDSPLTCSSLSSMQTSPHGSVNVSCSQMPGSMESMGDQILLKKRRKRRIKSEMEEISESLRKKEKIELKKNRKKKELLSINGNSQSGLSSNSSMETVPSIDTAIKAPLPIKLSLNAKTGSVSSNNNNLNNSLHNRNSKLTLPMASQPSNSSNAWMNQNNPLLKQSMKSESKHSNSLAEPILKNYKIPKKKSSDQQQQQQVVSVPYQDSVKTILHSNPSFNKSHQIVSSNELSKAVKESVEYLKSETEASSQMSSVIIDRNERPKTPIMLHPDAAVSLPMQTQLSNSMSENDFKHNCPDLSSNTGSTPPVKAKNIHDIVDKLRARTSSTSGSGGNIDPSSVSNASSAIASAIISEYSSSSLSKPTGASSFTTSNNSENNNNNQNSENIFEKFSGSKNNGKSDHRQFTNSRFPDSSCMNMQRYSYNRPPAGFPAPKIRPPAVGAPIQYGIPRQHYMNNPNMYRMDAAPGRNFPPGNPVNNPYGQKKTPNNSFPKKK